MSNKDLHQDRTAVDKVLRSMWKNWALSYGALTLPIIASLFLPPLWIPFICIIGARVLSTASAPSASLFVNSCTLIVRLTTRVLTISALIMFAIMLLCTDWIIPAVIKFSIYNVEIPFIICLIVYPVCTLVCIWWLYSGLSYSHCRKCQQRNGYYAGDSIVATLYYQEARHQARMLLLITIVVGGAEYWYYFFRYINSDFNTPDRFFFHYMPVVVYGLSLIMMWSRYQSLNMLYLSVEDSHHSRRDRTILRFLILSNNDMLLHQRRDGLLDTPAEFIIGRTNSIGDHAARSYIADKFHISDFSLRYCYTNDGFANGSIMIHYAVFVKESDRESLAEESSTWFDVHMLDLALAGKQLSPVLANELYRIHTITMAWKTYDHNGRRIYPIRHYRPTFRFSDMPSWDVDYDDQTWFDVAQNNEDSHFYRLRSLWKNITDAFTRKTRRV